MKKLDIIFLIIVCMVGALELLIIRATPLALSPDEAYYWSWSRQLALSYYDKGPVTAYLIHAFTWMFGHTATAVRAGALLCQLLFVTSIYLFVRSAYSAALALLAAVVFLSTIAFTTIGIFMTNDPPMMLFWCLSVVSAYNAVKRDNPLFWIWSLIFVGLATLCKDTPIILLPSYICFLLLTPRYRRHLISAGFISGCVLLGLCLLPILIWNAENDWTGPIHTLRLLTGSHKFRIQPGRFLELLAGQWGLIGPIISVLVIYCVWLGFSRWRKGDALSGLLLWSGLPLAGVCVGMSMFKPCYANWPWPIFIGWILLFIHVLANTESLFVRLRLWIRRGLLLNYIGVALSFALMSGESFGAPVKMLPTRQLVGWRELGMFVGDLVYKVSDCSSEVKTGCQPPIVATDTYQVASELAFYLPSQPTTYVVPTSTVSLNQFDVWGGWDRLKGRDILFVLKHSEEIESLRPHFRALNLVPDSSEYVVNYDGKVLRTFSLYIGRGYDGSRLPGGLMEELDSATGS